MKLYIEAGLRTSPGEKTSRQVKVAKRTTHANEVGVCTEIMLFVHPVCVSAGVASRKWLMKAIEA
jgi:hypothetical protein